SYSTVLDGLKADYPSTLLQLSFALRVSGLGATEVALEPPVEAGRLGDVSFRLSGQEFVAECYVQRAVPWTTSTEGMWLLRRIPKLLEQQHVTVSIAIQLNRPLDAAGRKKLLASLQRMLRQLDGSQTDERLLEKGAAWLVS